MKPRTWRGRLARFAFWAAGGVLVLEAVLGATVGRWQELLLEATFLWPVLVVLVAAIATRRQFLADRAVRTRLSRRFALCLVLSLALLAALFLVSLVTRSNGPTTTLCVALAIVTTLLAALSRAAGPPLAHVAIRWDECSIVLLGGAAMPILALLLIGTYWYDGLASTLPTQLHWSAIALYVACNLWLGLELARGRLRPNRATRLATGLTVGLGAWYLFQWALPMAAAFRWVIPGLLLPFALPVAPLLLWRRLAAARPGMDGLVLAGMILGFAPLALIDARILASRTLVWRELAQASDLSAGQLRPVPNFWYDEAVSSRLYAGRTWDLSFTESALDDFGYWPVSLYDRVNCGVEGDLRAVRAHYALTGRFLPTLSTDWMEPPEAELRFDDLALEVDAKAHNGIARMIWSFKVRNTGKRDREAWLSARLPEGAVVDGADLWLLNRVRRAATITGAGRAEQAYIAVTRRDRRDPLLVTHAGENRITMRVFPVPAGEYRRFQVSFLAPLRAIGQDMARLEIPFITATNVAGGRPNDMDLHVRGWGSRVTTAADGTGWLDLPHPGAPALSARDIHGHVWIIMDAATLREHAKDLAAAIEALPRTLSPRIVTATSTNLSVLEGAGLSKLEDALLSRSSPLDWPIGPALRLPLDDPEAALVVVLHGPQPLLLPGDKEAARAIRAATRLPPLLLVGPSNHALLNLIEGRIPDLRREFTTLARPIHRPRGGTGFDVMPVMPDSATALQSLILADLPEAPDLPALLGQDSPELETLNTAARVASLIGEGRAAEAEALALKAHIVSPTTSAIVLESEQDYKDHDIPLPPALSPVRKERRRGDGWLDMFSPSKSQAHAGYTLDNAHMVIAGINMFRLDHDGVDTALSSDLAELVPYYLQALPANCGDHEARGYRYVRLQDITAAGPDMRDGVLTFLDWDQVAQCSELAMVTGHDLAFAVRDEPGDYRPDDGIFTQCVYNSNDMQLALAATIGPARTVRDGAPP